MRFLMIILLCLTTSNVFAKNCDIQFKKAVDLYRCALSADKKVTTLKMREDERKGRKKLAAQFPNPEVESEFSFNSENSQNISILQPIETGGKRSSRIKIANAENRISVIEDDSTLAEVASNVAMALVQFRQVETRLQLLLEMKKSLRHLTKSLKAKAVITPEEKTALSIFLMQKTVLDTQILALNQKLGLIKTNLESSIGREIRTFEKLESKEKKHWPTLNIISKKGSFKSRKALASVEQLQGELDLQKSLSWPELAIGPTMERQDSNETSWGAKIEFTLPLFNFNSGGRQQAQAKLLRAKAIASQIKFYESSKVEIYIKQYNDVTQFLKKSPSQESLRSSVAESLSYLSRGMVQPSAIIESYRSTLETLEAIQKKELIAYKLYWMLKSFSGEIPKEFL